MTTKKKTPVKSKQIPVKKVLAPKVTVIKKDDKIITTSTKVENIVTVTTVGGEIIKCPRCGSFKMAQVKTKEWKCLDCGAGLSKE